MFRAFTLSLLFIAILACEARADVVVIVRREAEASGNYVRICDIARVEGPKEQAAEVARMVLGPTPPRGQALEISRWDIENRLYEMGITARVSFSGNDTVKVFGDGSRLRVENRDAPALRELNPVYDPSALRFDDSALNATPAPEKKAPAPLSSRPPPPERPAPKPAAAAQSGIDGTSGAMREKLGDAVSRYLAGRYKRSDIEITSSILSLSDAVLDAAEVTVEEAIGGRVPGKATLRLRVRDDIDSQPRQITVSADTEVYGLAPVAARALFPGETLTRRDVKVQRVKMESGRGYLPPDAASVEGREVKSAVAAGQPILASETVLGDAVKRGETVATESVGPGWRIQGNGKALGGGKVGDVIQVEDATNKAKFNARVIGKGKVLFLGRSGE